MSTEPVQTMRTATDIEWRLERDLEAASDRSDIALAYAGAVGAYRCLAFDLAAANRTLQEVLVVLDRISCGDFRDPEGQARIAAHQIRQRLGYRPVAAVPKDAA